MSFFAVLFALLIEQAKPLPRDNWVHQVLLNWVSTTGRHFDAGKPQHTWVVWAMAVLAPAVAVTVVYWLLLRFNLLLALAFNVAVLYLALGFRQFSHHFTEIRDALERGDETEARRVLSEWRRLDASELPRTEVLRHVVEHALLAAHRHVFGVFFWFVLLSAVGLGPAGAVMYRMAEFVSRRWANRHRAADLPATDDAQAASQKAFSIIDHVPARLTAFGFAVVGNFEEAVNGWRKDAGLWQHANEGIILAAAAGALGLQLGGGAPTGVTPDRAPAPPEAEASGSTQGAALELGHLQSVVGLVWRSVVLWMLLLALLSLANVLG